MITTAKALTKEQRAMLREQYKLVWHTDEHMVDYCTKKAAGYFETDDGYIVVFEKPSIRKSFWFGERNYEDRSDECRRASKSEEYFIRQNMFFAFGQDWEQRITDVVFDDLYVAGEAYYSQDATCRLAHIKAAQYKEELAYCKGTVRRMTPDECERYADAIENQKALFMKRLRSYLKRYGLSKCSYDTYWADR